MLADISNEPIRLPLGDEMIEFGRLRVAELQATVAYANSALLRAAMDALGPNASSQDRAAMVRHIAKRYSINDIGELLQDGDCVLHLLYLCYRRRNPNVTEEEFFAKFDLTDLPTMSSWVDILAGYQAADADDVEDDAGNPPAAPEGAVTGKAGPKSAGKP